MADAALVSKLDRFLMRAGELWKLQKEVKEKLEPAAKASEAFELAGKAMRTGQLPAYTEQIEKVREFCGEQNTKLAELARKDENYWMDVSGIDLFDLRAVAKAKEAFNDWIQNFQAMKMLMTELLPAVQMAAKVLSNPVVSGLRSGIAESSLPPLDGIALGEIAGNLNNSMLQIDLILPRLRNCLLYLR